MRPFPYAISSSILAAAVLVASLPLAWSDDSPLAPGAEAPGGAKPPTASAEKRIVASDGCHLTVRYHSSAVAEADVEGEDATALGAVRVLGKSKSFFADADAHVSDLFSPPRPQRQPRIHVEGPSPYASAFVKLDAPASGESEHPCGGTDGIILIGAVEVVKCECAGCLCKEHELTVAVSGELNGVGRSSGSPASWGFEAALNGVPFGRKPPAKFSIPFSRTVKVRVPTGARVTVYVLRIGYTANNGTDGSASLTLSAFANETVVGAKCLR